MKKIIWIFAILMGTNIYADTKSSKDTVTANAEDEVVSASTNIDFSETLIEGKMKAPEGFLLSGRQANALSQMVKLRSHFRKEIKSNANSVNANIK